MSLEDVGSAGVVVDDKPDPYETQSQDGIVLVQMAGLSMHMFAPADFKGKFRKIQPRKRPTIFKEGISQVLLWFSDTLLALTSWFVTTRESSLMCNLIRSVFNVLPSGRLPSLPHTQDIKLVFLVFFLSQPNDSLQFASVVKLKLCDTTLWCHVMTVL